MSSSLEILVEDPRSADGQALIAASDRMSTANYKPGERYPVDVDELAGADFALFVARENDRAVGCVALRRFADYGELKRMFVVDEARGRGIGHALLARVEAEAEVAALPLIRLETGIYQKEALSLYRRAGYRECTRFGAYRPNKTSIYLEKPIPVRAAS